MDAVKFLEEYNRMCNTYNDCVGCPIHDKPFCHPHDMTTNDERKELVDAVERWSYEHPIVTNGMSDTINRAMAINALFELYEYQRDIDPTEAADLVRQGIYLAEKKIEQLPSAQPEQKKGEWINRSLNILYPEWERYTCSACGKHSYSYDFCPNCGADMRGEHDGNK